MVTCWFYLSRVECWLFAHFTQTLFESRLWNGWNCISYTTNTKASPSNETLQGNFIALDCTLLWERDESNTTAMYHHRFGYTLWERNKHNIEEMKNKHKYKTLIKIRNIVNNRFYPLTVAWRKNSWAEQVRASQSKSVLYDVCRFERHADWCFNILKTAQSWPAMMVQSLVVLLIGQCWEFWQIQITHKNEMDCKLSPNQQY